MADITMCNGVETGVIKNKLKILKKGKTCPLRDNCLRHIVEPSPVWQSFFINMPYNFKKKECKYYQASI